MDNLITSFVNTTGPGWPGLDKVYKFIQNNELSLLAMSPADL